MKIYLDFVFMINFIFDFLILVTVSLLLKRNTKLKRLLIGSGVGSLSIFLLFVSINSFTLFLLKILMSVVMVYTSFGRRDFFKNFVSLYFVSILLGGFIYFLNNLFSYKVEGIIFIHNGFSINLILLMILSPIILYFYVKQSHSFENKLSNIHIVEITYLNKTYSYQGYFDTGNHLREPYRNRIVHILYDPSIYFDTFFYIPYEMIGTTGILKGIVVDKMVIDHKYTFKKVVIGISQNNFHLDSCQLILNSSLKRHIS